MYGPVEDEASIATIQHAIEAGITLIDTADAYGNGHNEQLVGRAIAGRREQTILASKFGIVFSPGESGTPIGTNWEVQMSINGRPDYVSRALEASLKRLGTDYLDLWYLHYPDPAVPIEETVGAMAQAVQAGKVRYLGLSNVKAEQLRLANQVHPISAVQYEYSLWARGAEQSIIPTARELGIGIVPWAPLGSGFLGGGVSQVSGEDFRTRNPRFSQENLQLNQDRFAPLMGLAQELGLTPAQLALAWLLHQGEDIVPIPGTRKAERIDENLAASEVKLSSEQLAQIDKLAPAGLAAGKTLL
jgi:aryl-alcohol dehydrogenase-like predicted oxidoreductase